MASNTNQHHGHYTKSFSKIYHSNQSHLRTSSKLSKFPQKLANCLVLFLFLTGIISPPVIQASSISRPDLATLVSSRNNVTRSRVADRILKSTPAWHNPCGNKHRFQDLRYQKKIPFFLNIQKPNDDDLMHGIVNMAKMALRQSRYFKEDYVSTHFF